jgi:adsorption protein B
MVCVGRIYGIALALGVPVRAVYANVLNAAATGQGVYKFLHARLHGLPLKWVKTEHAYPSRTTLLEHRRKLGDILVGAGQISADVLAEALRTQISGVRLGEQLVRSGSLTELVLYEYLAFQQGLPLAEVDVAETRTEVAHSLPRHVAEELTVLPFRIADGGMDVASPEAPNAQVVSALRGFTALDVRFHLVTPAEFERLAGALL